MKKRGKSPAEGPLEDIRKMDWKIGRELERKDAEIERLRAALELVDSYWTSGIRDGENPPWPEVREALGLAHEQRSPEKEG